MFLLRAAFWLSVVVILLPADPRPATRRRGSPHSRRWSRRARAVGDLSPFCDRNPDVCDTGGTAFQVFADKVRYGAKMIYGYFGDGKPASRRARGTLKPDDIEPAWRDPAKGDESA